MTRTDLTTAPWLDWPGTRAVMAALEAARADGARFVGVGSIVDINMTDAVEVLDHSYLSIA